VRINGVRIDAASRAVKPGDVVTVALDRTVRVMKVLAFAARRGDVDAASVLYEELAPFRPPPAPPERDAGSRPTKRERRELDRLRGRDED
jgi:ribosome-associated heat shock protein Hsp15